MVATVFKVAVSTTILCLSGCGSEDIVEQASPTRVSQAVTTPPLDATAAAKDRADRHVKAGKDVEALKQQLEGPDLLVGVRQQIAQKLRDARLAQIANGDAVPSVFQAESIQPELPAKSISRLAERAYLDKTRIYNPDSSADLQRLATLKTALVGQ